MAYPGQGMGAFGPPPVAPRPVVPVLVRRARVLAIVGVVLNGAWGLAVGILAIVLYGFALLGIMWGSACGPAETEALGLICSRTAWPALGVAGGGVVLTGILQAIAIPVLWRRDMLLIPAVVGFAITAATAVVGWQYAQAGLG